MQIGKQEFHTHCGGLSIYGCEITVRVFRCLSDCFKERPVKLDSLVTEYEVLKLGHASLQYSVASTIYFDNVNLFFFIPAESYQ